MGRSRRRMKKHSKPVTSKAKKKVKSASKVPLELKIQSSAIEKRLGIRTCWDSEKTLQENYVANGFTNSLKQSHGRNIRSNKTKEVEGAVKITEDFGDDDELRALNNKQRKTGKAAPKRLTPHQKQIVERLIEEHGHDVEAMARDRKLNELQHTEGKLRMMIESYEHWQGTTGVDFRVPNKRLW